MKRWMAVLLTMLMVASLALTGCSKGTDEKPSTNEETKAQGESKEPEVSAEEVVITLSHWGTETDAATYRERADMYEAAHPGVKIDINHIPNDYVQKLTTMVAGGSIPDIMVLAEDIHSFSSKGVLLPLNDYIGKAGIDLEARVGKTAADAYTYDGNIYGIPDRGGCMVLFYNKDMFDAANLEYPTADWKWEDMLKAAKALTGGTGEEETWGFATEMWWPYWMTWVYQAGGRIVDENGNLTLNSPEALKALTFLQELTTVHDVMPTREEYANMGSGAGMATAFVQGRIGMVPNGLWYFASLKDAAFRYDVVELYGEDERATVPFGSAMAVSSSCEHPDIAFDIVNYMTDVEAQEVIVKHLEDAPANLEVLNSDTFKNAGWSATTVDIEAFARSSEMLVAPPIGPDWSSWDTIFSDEMAGVFDGTVDPQTAINNVEKRIQELH